MCNIVLGLHNRLNAQDEKGLLQFIRWKFDFLPFGLQQYVTMNNITLILFPIQFIVSIYIFSKLHSMLLQVYFDTNLLNESSRISGVEENLSDKGNMLMGAGACIYYL